MKDLNLLMRSDRCRWCLTWRSWCYLFTCHLRSPVSRRNIWSPSFRRSKCDLKRLKRCTLYLLLPSPLTPIRKLDHGHAIVIIHLRVAADELPEDDIDRGDNTISITFQRVWWEQQSLQQYLLELHRLPHRFSSLDFRDLHSVQRS